MPKENKRRGRREEKKEEKKRKRREEAEIEKESKKQKFEGGNDFIPLPGNVQDVVAAVEDEAQTTREIPFYGLLDENEQEYFKRADEMLELNQFANAEERNIFLENIYKEADGKELKIVNSQSCSRLMERLILLSTPTQLKNLFQKFSGHFLNLVQHRFASHCCETLFLRAAPVVVQELTAPLESQQAEAGGDLYVSMENLFLFTLNELEGNLGYLMTDRFASHVLRVLLTVFSGQPLTIAETNSVLRSKKKEKISVAGLEPQMGELKLEKRQVPEVFQTAIDKILTETVSGLDTTYLRSLATHPTGNPALQLLLELELSKPGKGRENENSILKKLLPDDPPAEGTESVSFVNGLLYDPVGSRLLEAILKHAPGKTFKMLYRSLLKERLGSLARNETAGYVVIRALERLSKQDLEEAVQLILPQIGGLVERSRTIVIKAVIERCAARGVDTAEIAKTLRSSYGEDASTRLANMLKVDLDGSRETGDDEDRPQKIVTVNPQQLHGSSLAQSMVNVPGPLSELIFESLLALARETLVAVAENPAASRVLQVALTSATSTTQFKRKAINSLFGEIGRLATHTTGSHVVDALWIATAGLAHYKERIATELLNNEATMRESLVGRAVWRNWMMDLFKQRKTDWIAKAKAGNGRTDTFGKTPGADKGAKKSAIDLARQKFANAKLGKEKPGTKFGAPTGANSVMKKTQQQ